MATTKKKTPVKKASTKARPSGGALSVGPPPSPDKDPAAQAEYFMEMLDALGQQGSPEAARIRLALIEAVADYAKAEDKEAAAKLLKAHMLGIELGVARLLLGTTEKLRDRFIKESRKLGTKSKQGQVVRQSAEAFELLADGFAKMVAAAEAQDEALRAEAHRVLDQAGTMMKALEGATR